MNYRNAKRTAQGHVDCEIEHETFGWIPFTCDPSDTGAGFDVAALFAAMDADPSTAPYVPPSEAEVLAAASAEARSLRASLLARHVDAFVMNALRWADLTAGQQGEITDYRRALLDITDQPGFPTNIAWPEVPAFAQ